ncbi:signal peptidase I [Candidatus Peregrinibacteria bacterium]|nr:signal peptidase I [Candidatus Peregrinibacteria bacterium]
MALAKSKPKAPRAGKRREFRRFIRESGLFLADILYNAVIIILLVILIRTFLISPFRIIGSSMADTLKSNEFILIDKLSYRLSEPKRGNTVVFRPPITNKYPHKFEEAVTTDAEGIATLGLSELETSKSVIYCENRLLRSFFFCQEGVNEGDLVFYRAISRAETGAEDDIGWKRAEKRIVTKEEADSNKLVLEGEPETSYLIRIYSQSGPEYFVKRIIGIPGDTIKIENGRLYRKLPDSEAYSEIQESYLNEENRLHTYLAQKDGGNTFTVPEGHYLLLGDNRNHSNDARSWFSPVTDDPTPFVSRENISGRVLIVLWPFGELRLIPPSGNL